MSGLQMKYFVLKPKGKDAYAHASRCAMLEYSKAIAMENIELSREVEAWALQEDYNAHFQPDN